MRGGGREGWAERRGEPGARGTACRTARRVEGAAPASVALAFKPRPGRNGCGETAPLGPPTSRPLMGARDTHN
jgi:hypothetical protein